MSLEDDLFQTLAAIPAVNVQASPLEGRAYPSVFPQSFTLPAIRYVFVDVVPVTDLCGDGDDDTAVPRIQLDAVANTFKAARALRLSIMAAMRTFVPPAILEISSMDYDAETKTHRATLDYTFHGSSNATP